MTRVVLDTNVLLSGLLSQASVPGRIVQAWKAGSFDLIISPPILAELTRALREPYFRERLTAKDIADLLAALAEQATIVEPAGPIPRIATQPEDDLILATADVAGAHYLVTGDKHLQAITLYRDCAIVTPRAFLQIVSNLES